MKTIDRDAARIIREHLSVVLDPLGRELGLQFNIGGISFSPTNANIKVTAAVIGESGQAQTKERQEFERWAKLYNMEPEWLDRTIKVYGETYTIKGFKPRCSKFPVLVMRADGKMFKFPIETVKVAMKAVA